MDRTVTRRPTYMPFLLHCAIRRAPWRLLFVPLVVLSMLAYAARLIDRGRLKEINHRLLLGAKIHPRELKPLVDSFADAQVASNVRPGARKAIARDKAEGRRAGARDRFIPPLRRCDRGKARVRRRDRHQLDHGARRTRPCQDRRRKLLWPGKAADDRRLGGASGLKGAHGHVRFYSDHVSDRPAFEWADEPVAVNPHGKLLRLAEQRGWA